MGNRQKTEKLVFIALLVALSVVLGIIDNFISSFASAQGVRIGLANIVILTSLYYLSFRESLLLIMLKSVLTSFILGNFQMFTIGLSGSLLSFFIMYFLLKRTNNSVSNAGVSVAGSIGHNVGQILALIFYFGYAIVFSLFWLIPIGIATGLFVGYVVSLLRIYLDKGQVFKSITHKNKDQSSLEQLINEK